MCIVLHPQRFNESEVIYEEDYHPHEMYFISNGRCSYIYQSYIYKTLVKGSYFGEIEILFGTGRLNTVAADVDTEIELLSLDKDDLRKILEEYPSVAKEMKEIAEIKMSKN